RESHCERARSLPRSACGRESRGRCRRTAPESNNRKTLARSCCRRGLSERDVLEHPSRRSERFPFRKNRVLAFEPLPTLPAAQSPLACSFRKRFLAIISICV